MFDESGFELEAVLRYHNSYVCCCEMDFCMLFLGRETCLAED